MNNLASVSPLKHTVQWTQISGREHMTPSNLVGHREPEGYWVVALG